VFRNEILVKVFTSVHFIIVGELTKKIFTLFNNDYMTVSGAQYYL